MLNIWKTMSSSWKRVIISFVVAVFCWYVVLIPENFGVVMELEELVPVILYAAVAATILCICFFVTVIVSQIRPGSSGYKIFAWTDGLIGVCVTIYAIYDIQTDTGWFAGLFGMLLLIVVVPTAVVLIIIDAVLYTRAKNQNKGPEC